MPGLASRCSRMVLIFLLFFLPAPCYSWPAKVVAVLDGDSLVVRQGGQKHEVRLYGIDCPEGGQAFGPQAKALTTSLVAGRKVEIETKSSDQYGRILALVQIDGQYLNLILLQNGFAWLYNHYCHDPLCREWAQVEAAARQQKRGLWQSAGATPPWEWRQEHKRAAVAPVPTDSIPEILIGPRMPAPATVSGGQAAAAGSFRCDGRTYCSQMTSCAEATFFLRNCPGTKMDGNNDGIPCERQWCH